MTRIENEHAIKRRQPGIKVGRDPSEYKLNSVAKQSLDESRAIRTLINGIGEVERLKLQYEAREITKIEMEEGIAEIRKRLFLG